MLKFNSLFYLDDIFRGLFIVLRNVFSRKVTLNYPFDKGALSTRFRRSEEHTSELQSH